MKRIAVIHASIPVHQGEHWKRIVARYCTKTRWFEPLTERGNLSVCCRFDARDPKYYDFLGVLKDRGAPLPQPDGTPGWRKRYEASLKEPGVKWSERFEHVHTETELRAASLLEFSVALAPRDLGVDYPEQFDYATGCPHCKTGARQAGPVRVDPAFKDAESGFRREGMICQSMDYDYFVRGELYAALGTGGLRGLELTEAVSASGAPLGWWQLIARHIMPRMDPDTRGISRGRDRDGQPLQGCCHCDRDNYFHSTTEPSQIAYRRSSLGDVELPDSAFTWECFGLSRVQENRHLARPRLLVSPKVFDVFRRLKVRSVRFAPVRIIED